MRAFVCVCECARESSRVCRARVGAHASALVGSRTCGCACVHVYDYYNIILEWTTRLDTSSRTLFVREGGRMSVRMYHVTSNVELRNNVRLLLNVELRNYVISRQTAERRVTSDCYLNIVVSLDC